MGRILALLLGGVCLCLYAPHLFLGGDMLEGWVRWWQETLGKLGPHWYSSIFQHGPGVFAGLALILIAIRGKE